MMSLRFPIAIWPWGKGSGLLFADLSDRPVLRGRRALTNKRTLAVPRNIVRSRPTVSASHPLPVLNRDMSRDIVKEAAYGPAMVRLAGIVRVGRFAVQKHIWPANVAAEHKSMSCGLSFTSLDQAHRTVDIKGIPATARDLRNHIERFAVLHSHPFCLSDVDSRVAEMDRRDVADPDVLGEVHIDEIPSMFLVREILVSFLFVVNLRFLSVEFGIAP